MKIKAGDLRYGQRFLRWELNCLATGMVTKSGQCLHLVEGEIGRIDKDREVELIEPAHEPTYTEQEKAAEDIFPPQQPWDDPGQGWRLLGPCDNKH